MTSVKTLRKEKRAPNLTLPCNQTDEYLKYQHRTVIQKLIETAAEPASEQWTELPKVQLKSGGVRKGGYEQRGQDLDGNTH